MDGRVLVAFALFAAAFAVEELGVEIEESGEKFKEIVDFDFKNGFEIIKVPAHGEQIEAVEVLKDMKMGFKAIKMPRVKHCYVLPLEKNELNMYEFEAGIFLARNKIPKKNIIRHYENILVIGDIPNAWNSQVLKDFCGANKIVMGEAHESTENLEKVAKRLAIESRRDQRKRAVMREFVACDKTSAVTTISTCKVTKLTAKCRLKTKSCYYSLSCPLEMSSGGFKCSTKHHHHSIVCCDFECKN